MSILSSMRYCLGPPDSFGNMWAALAFMPLGLFFDFMDGKVARWRGKSSLMGQELDSLADLVHDRFLLIVTPACPHPGRSEIRPALPTHLHPFVASMLIPHLDFLRCGTCSVRLCSWPPYPTRYFVTLLLRPLRAYPPCPLQRYGLFPTKGQYGQE